MKKLKKIIMLGYIFIIGYTGAMEEPSGLKTFRYEPCFLFSLKKDKFGDKNFRITSESCSAMRIENNELNDAIRKGDLEELSKLCTNNESYKNKVKSDPRLLIMAAKRGNLEIVQFLIQRGAQFNATNHFRDAALHQIVSLIQPVYMGNLLSVQEKFEIIEKLEQINDIKCGGVTDSEFFTKLVYNSVFSSKAEEFYKQMNNSDMNYSKCIQFFDTDSLQSMENKTPGSAAIFKAYHHYQPVAVMQALIHAGADIFQKGFCGDTPLIRIVRFYKLLPEKVKPCLAHLLLEAHARGRLDEYLYTTNGFGASVLSFRPDLKEIYEQHGQQGILNFCYQMIGTTNAQQPNVFLALQDASIGIKRKRSKNE